jgi:hypothetical protein
MFVALAEIHPASESRESIRVPTASRWRFTETTVSRIAVEPELGGYLGGTGTVKTLVPV